MSSPVSEQEVKDLIASLVSSPPDFSFAFLNEQGEVLGELRAHKQLLSVRSSYFRQLFGDEVGVGVINLKPEHRRPVKALIAQVYNSADLPEILDQLDLPDLLALGSFGEEYQLAGVKEVAVERLASFSLPPVEQAALAAASEARKYPLLGEKMLVALHRNCAKTLLFTVRTDKQVKEFLKRYQGTEHELFSLKMKELMNQYARDPNRDEESLDKKEGVVLITKEYLKKMQREKVEEEKREKQKEEKEEKLMSSRRKRERRKEKEVVMTTGGVKGDEYNMEEVLAALGEIKKEKQLKVKKHPPRSTVKSTDARETEIPLSASDTLVEVTSPSCSSFVNQNGSVDGETSEIKAIELVSQGLVAETSQHILFDENLFDENLDDEDLESPQPVIKEMYEPAAPLVENKQTSQGLNWDAKEFIPRDSPTPPSWVVLLPADPTLPYNLRLASPIPHNTQPQLVLPPYGSNNLALQHQKPLSPCQANPGMPDDLVSQNHPRSGVGSLLQCSSIEANIGHPGSPIQNAQGSEMSPSPDVLGCPSQPVHGLVHPPIIDQIHQHGRINFPGIVPVSSFFTPVQSRHPHEAAWAQHPSTIIQSRMPVLLHSAVPQILPDVPHMQSAHPLPLIIDTDLSRGEQPHGTAPSSHLQGHEEMFSSPLPSSPPMPRMSSPPCSTSPDISFLQPSFLSPTYHRAKHVAPGF